MQKNTQVSWDLKQIVKELRLSREKQNLIHHSLEIKGLPSRQIMEAILIDLCSVLFPMHFREINLNHQNIDDCIERQLKNALNQLVEQVKQALYFDEKFQQYSEEALQKEAILKVSIFSQQLNVVRELLISDIHAAYKGDPAAQSLTEVMLCYPGILAMIHHRLAHVLYQLKVPLLPRLINQIAHSMTGIDIHPGAQIGANFFIDHGTGVVIGETAIIGKDVRIYQMVTLGAKSFPADEDGHLIKGHQRHPIVEDQVIIYANATILGRVTIGKGSIIGGNVWLTHSVPENSRVSQKQANQSCEKKQL